VQFEFFALATADNRGKNLMALSPSNLTLALSGIGFSQISGTAFGHALP
jgi:hypothetical protein